MKKIPSFKLANQSTFTIQWGYDFVYGWMIIPHLITASLVAITMWLIITFGARERTKVGKVTNYFNMAYTTSMYSTMSTFHLVFASETFDVHKKSDSQDHMFALEQAKAVTISKLIHGESTTIVKEYYSYRRNAAFWDLLFGWLFNTLFAYTVCLIRSVFIDYIVIMFMFILDRDTLVPIENRVLDAYGQQQADKRLKTYYLLVSTAYCLNKHLEFSQFGISTDLCMSHLLNVDISEVDPDILNELQQALASEENPTSCQL